MKLRKISPAVVAFAVLAAAAPCHGQNNLCKATFHDVIIEALRCVKPGLAFNEAFVTDPQNDRHPSLLAEGDGGYFELSPSAYYEWKRTVSNDARMAWMVLRQHYDHTQL